MNRPFQPPAVPPISDGFKQQFDTLRDYLIRWFFPYLFDYLNDLSNQPLNALRCSLQFNETPDGSRTTFTLREGAIRLLPQGRPSTIGTPQALLWHTDRLLQYVTTPGALVTGTWTLVTSGTPPMQTIQVFDPPFAGNAFFIPLAVIAS